MKAQRNISIIWGWGLLLLFFIPTENIAQVEKGQNEYQKAFDEFNNSIKQDFDSFKSKNDSIFYEFLKQSWQTFKFSEDARPSIPKPIVQPVSDTVTIRNIEITPIKRRIIDQKTNNKIAPRIKQTITRDNVTSNHIPDTFTEFEFYGLKVKVPKQTETTQYLNTISNEYVASYFMDACNNDEIIATISFLQESAVENKLNGWGFLELLQDAASSLYDDSNNQALFSWYTLLTSGFDAKVGYNNQDIFLMTTFDLPVYFRSYFETNDKKYYLVLFNDQDENQTSINSYTSDYPVELLPLSLKYYAIPNFKLDKKTRIINYNGQSLTLAYNNNLTKYYKDYPECNLSVYFTPPLSQVALKSLGEYIVPRIENGTNVEKINFLLNFVQYGIVYETDDKQFGRENYLFAEETICYPYADCEDRSVLLSQLVREFTGLNTIGIIYPGHASLAVDINETFEGAYVEHNNKKYYMADPTYIGAKLGMVMPDYKNVQPEIIEF